jgi:uncharacterized RDD family membrane protein YckC
MEIDNERPDTEMSPQGTVEAPEASLQEMLSVEMAGLVRRGISACIDLVGAACVGGLLVLQFASMDLGAAIEGRWGLLDQAVDIIVRYPGFAALVIQSVLGCVLCWHLLFMVLIGRTPGHFLMGLCLLDHQAQPPTLLRAFLHGLLRLGSLCLMCCGHVWFFIDPERRTLYDRLAGLYVVLHSPQQISE